jgi:NTE family protein
VGDLADQLRERAIGTFERAHSCLWRFLYGSGDGYRRSKIGLALGGGFARGIAHLGVLEVLEENRVPLAAITGVSSGAMMAAAYASGTPLYKLDELARRMKFKDVAGWTISRMGLMTSHRMNTFLRRLLAVHKFEDMWIPLGVVACDLKTGDPVVFSQHGDVVSAVRASCAYPGLFRPIAIGGKLLVDGGMALDVPAPTARQLGAAKVIAVSLEMDEVPQDPSNLAQVINRCFQILQAQTGPSWRPDADLVLTPKINTFDWDSFDQTERLIMAGRQAAEAALPQIEEWLERK